MDDGNSISFKNHTNMTTPSSVLGSHANATSTQTVNSTQQPSIHCIFPSYFSHFAILILIAISVVTQLSHLTKILLMVIVTGKMSFF
jgi:hypothetical protein